MPGVAQVQRGGGVNREIRVELDPARMQALGITAVQVNEQLRNLNLDSPGGRAQLGGGEQAIRVLGGARTAAALGDTQIMLPGGRFARLSDLADVSDSVGEIRTIARLNGRPATTFGVIKTKGSSDVTVYDGVQAELAKIRKENPEVEMTQVFTTVDYTKETYHSALSAFIEGSLLAVLVVWLFLRDMRATMISALAIPLSAIPTFAFMSWMGFTLNSISLLALSLVAGVLVDDAIVEIENIVRHMRMGKSGFQAALDAADQIGLAVVATSSTIIAVFLPVSFMGGIIGQFFKQFGLTVAAAVFFSLLVARLITPVIAAYTLRSDSLPHHTDGPVMHWYLRVLSWCARHRWKTVAAGAAFFALSIVGLMLIPKSFLFPRTTSTPRRCTSSCRRGCSSRRPRRPRRPLTASSPASPRSQTWSSRSATTTRACASAELDIALVPAKQRHVTPRQFEDRVIKLLRVIPDAQVHFFRGNGGSDIVFYITGDDPQVTYTTAHKVVDEMRAACRCCVIRASTPTCRSPEIVIRPRLDLAAPAGRHGGEHQRHDPHRDPGGSRPEQRQVLTVRSPDSDPREPAREQPQGPGDAREPAGTDRERRQRAAQGGGRHQLRPGADARAALQPEPAPQARGRSQQRCHDRHRNGAGSMRCRRSKHLPPGVRLVDMGDAKYMNELFSQLPAGHGHRHPDGVRSAGAAVRARAAADHHSVGAAACRSAARWWRC